MSLKLRALLVCLMTAMMLCATASTAMGWFVPVTHASFPSCVSGGDGQFPPPVSLRVELLHRGGQDGLFGHGPYPDRDLGVLRISIDGYHSHVDTQVGRDGSIEGSSPELGLRLHFEGQKPEGLRAPDRVIVPSTHHDFVEFRWDDGEDYDQPLDMEVRATWVHCSGNEGPTSSALEVPEPGVLEQLMGTGCSTSQGGGSPMAVVILLGLLVGWRGRRAY